MTVCGGKQEALLAAKRSHSHCSIASGWCFGKEVAGISYKQEEWTSEGQKWLMDTKHGSR